MFKHVQSHILRINIHFLHPTESYLVSFWVLATTPLESSAEETLVLLSLEPLSAGRRAGRRLLLDRLEPRTADGDQVGLPPWETVEDGHQACLVLCSKGSSFPSKELVRSLIFNDL